MPMYKYLKRAVDFLLALVLLILLSPVLIFLIILLGISGDGAIFFFQNRMGFQAKDFDIWKFATMRKGSARMKGGAITLNGDPRVTLPGKFLRASKLNELPQLINVIKGEMSIVGPRPLIRKSFEQYPPEIQASINTLKPGITGIGSIVFRNEAFLMARAGVDPHVFYKEQILPYKGKLEDWYVNNQTFRTDLLILGLTAYVLFMPATPQLIFKIFPSLPKSPSFLEKDYQVDLVPISRRSAGM